MPRKRHTPEEIVAKLRQVDVLVSHGVPVAAAVRQPLKSSSLQPRGRLRHTNRLRRLRWRRSRQCTNIPHGPPNGG
jgi:hypothetical protein